MQGHSGSSSAFLEHSPSSPAARTPQPQGPGPDQEPHLAEVPPYISRLPLTAEDHL